MTSYHFVKIHFAIILSSILLFGCNNNSSPSANSTTAKIRRLQKGGVTLQLRPEPLAKGNSAENTSTIKIGLVTSESGPLSPWGIECKKGVQLAVNHLNKLGGIKGKKIELLIEDSASKAEQAKTAAEKLIAEGVVGIIGEIGSGKSAQVAHATFNKGIPQVIMAASQEELTTIGANIFRTCYTNDYQGPIMAKFAYDDLQLRKVALFTDKKLPYSVTLCNAFRKKFEELGGEIVDEQFYESGQTQFTPQLTNVKSKNPEALFIAGYYLEVGPILRQAVALGMKVHKLGGDGWDNDEILTSGGKAVLGSYHSMHFHHSEKRKAVKDFLKLWEQEYGGIPRTFCAALAYDSALIMIEGLKKADKLTSPEITKAISKIEALNCATGKITFKGCSGNAKKRALVVAITEQGRIIQKKYQHSDIFGKS